MEISLDDDLLSMEFESRLLKMCRAVVEGLKQCDASSPIRKTSSVLIDRSSGSIRLSFCIAGFEPVITIHFINFPAWCPTFYVDRPQTTANLAVVQDGLRNPFLFSKILNFLPPHSGEVLLQNIIRNHVSNGDNGGRLRTFLFFVKRWSVTTSLSDIQDFLIAVLV